jgi:uncharacterized protein (DUF1697 family)
MTAIISMLRGVNLGGNRKIKMDALRALYESLGFKDPQTYVQSGNVVFRSTSTDLTRVTREIEAAIEKTFGFHSDAILRTASEMRAVVENNPFNKRDEVEPSKLLVTFLPRDPGAEIRKRVQTLDSVPEELHCSARELYIYFPNGMARARLSWPALEKILQTTYTGRNWNTVGKLLEMADRLETPTPAPKKSKRR